MNYVAMELPSFDPAAYNAEPFPFPRNDLGILFVQFDIRVHTEGDRDFDFGLTTIVECGFETISNSSIRQSYNITEYPFHLSWEQSKDNAALRGSRLATVDEVRYLIATKAGQT